jgi:hypothetical protein
LVVMSLLSHLVAFACMCTPNLQDGTPLYKAEQVQTSRNVLENGAAIYAQRSESRHVSVQLFISNRSALDTESNHGYRHLLEHIVARSIPALDETLETRGGYLRADTSRDYIRFEWMVKPADTQLAVEAMRRFISAPKITAEDIDRESQIIGQEIELMTDIEQSSLDAWSVIFGLDGLDPWGKFSKIRAADADELKRLWRRLTEPQNLIVSACGDIDVEKFTKSVSQMLAPLSEGEVVAIKSRGFEGGYRGNQVFALPVHGLLDKRSAGQIVFAFGLASHLKRPYVVFSPSRSGSISMVGTYDEAEEIGKVLSTTNASEMFEIGLQASLAWAERKQTNPSAVAELIGQLMCVDRGLNTSKLKDLLKRAKFEDFSAARAAALTLYR